MLAISSTNWVACAPVTAQITQLSNSVDTDNIEQYLWRSDYVDDRQVALLTGYLGIGAWWLWSLITLVTDHMRCYRYRHMCLRLWNSQGDIGLRLHDTSGPLHGYVTAMFTLLANHNLKWLQLNWIEVHGSYGTARVTAIASMASGCRVMYIHVKLNPKYIHSYGTALVTLVAGYLHGYRSHGYE